MHIIQEKLLKLANERNIGDLKLREIGKLIDVNHPQLIKHHLNQLEKKGLVIINKARGIIKRMSKDYSSQLMAIPILGSANCGPAELYADSNIEGYLRVSPELVKSRGDLFALRAVGDSMNKAVIGGNTIENGDYVIVTPRSEDVKNKDYVVSVIDGVCNIKKIFVDEQNNQIILLSESNKKFAPIIINPTSTDYFINGKVVQVIKTPKNI